MDKKIEMNKFHEIELEKSFELMQTSQNLRIQVSIFFATVNLGALSFGISQGKAVFFLFAAILFWVMIVVDIANWAMLAHAYYRIIYIHKLYIKNDLTFSPYLYSFLASEIVKIVNVKDEKERLKALKALTFSFRNFYGFWLPLVASIIEITVGLVLWKVVGWNLI